MSIDFPVRLIAVSWMEVLEDEDDSRLNNSIWIQAGTRSLDRRSYINNMDKQHRPEFENIEAH
jgi:hypothetical protein